MLSPMKLFISVVVTCAFVTCSKALWISEMTSARGWDVGNGLVLKLNEAKNASGRSALERVSLDVNYGDLGMTVAKAEQEGVKLDLYMKERDVEGRGKKDKKDYVLPLIVGYKTATMMALVFGTLKLLSLKALFMAKISLLISLVIFLMKLKHHGPEYVEIDHHHGEHSSNLPVYMDYRQGGFHSSLDGRDMGYYSFHNGATGAESESGYSTLESSTVASGSDGVRHPVNQDGENRRSSAFADAARKRYRPDGMLLTIKKYTEEARGKIR